MKSILMILLCLYVPTGLVAQEKPNPKSEEKIKEKQANEEKTPTTGFSIGGEYGTSSMRPGSERQIFLDDFLLENNGTLQNRQLNSPWNQQGQGKYIDAYLGLSLFEQAPVDFFFEYSKFESYFKSFYAPVPSYPNQFIGQKNSKIETELYQFSLQFWIPEFAYQYFDFGIAPNVRQIKTSIRTNSLGFDQRRITSTGFHPGLEFSLSIYFPFFDKLNLLFLYNIPLANSVGGLEDKIQSSNLTILEDNSIIYAFGRGGIGVRSEKKEFIFSYLTDEYVSIYIGGREERISSSTNNLLEIPLHFRETSSNVLYVEALLNSFLLYPNVQAARYNTIFIGMSRSMNFHTNE